MDYSRFLQPDPIWEIFGMKSQQDFINSFVTVGKFHKNVPESIRNDYKIVERLQYYSYYYYSFIDEAFGKSTRIFEASVDLKVSELKLSKKGFESLSSKINKLEKHTSIELYKRWIEAKDIRNMFAHHKAGRQFGITLINVFKHNINMINSIFLNKDEIQEIEKSLESLKKRSEHLKKGLFRMEYKGQSILIWSIVPYSSCVNSNIEKSFWVAHSVYKIKMINDVIDFPDPFMLSLKNVEIKKNGMNAIVIDSNEIISLSKTVKDFDKKSYENHLIQMIGIKLKLKQLYWNILERKVKEAIADFLYNHSWK